MLRDQGRIEGIDLLRALAITMVLVHHTGRGLLKGYVPSLLGEAWTGVDLFFLISGYLVTRSFAQWLENADAASEFAFRARLAIRYCLRRLLRIIPPAWLWAALPLIGSIYLNRSGAFGAPSEVLKEFFAVLTFQYNYFAVSSGLNHINHFWSLAVEEHYYIFLPCFLFLVPKKKSRLVGFFSIAVVCEAIRVIARHSGYGFGGVLFLTHFRVDSLAIGSAIGLLSDEIRSRFTDWYSHGLTKICLQAMAVVAIAFLWIAPEILSKSQIIYFGFSLFAILSAFLVVFGTSGERLIPIPGFLKRSIAIVGRRSYSLYLVHVPLIHLFAEFRLRTLGGSPLEAWTTWKPAAVELVVFLVTLAGITELNFRYIEYPLIQWGRSRFRESLPAVTPKALVPS